MADKADLIRGHESDRKRPQGRGDSRRAQCFGGEIQLRFQNAGVRTSLNTQPLAKTQRTNSLVYRARLRETRKNSTIGLLKFTEKRKRNSARGASRGLLRQGH